MSNKTNTIGARVSPELDAKINYYAVQREMDTSEYIRYAMRKQVQRDIKREELEKIE